MSEITLAIGKKIYKIDADDESKHAIIDLAKSLNKKINTLYYQNPDLDHDHIMMFNSLLLINEIESLKVSMPSNTKNADNSDEIQLKLLDLEIKVKNLINYFTSK